MCSKPATASNTSGEPILEVTAPIAEGQLVETYLLNQVTFQTTVASKAARCVIAASGRDVVDFSMRRTQVMNGSAPSAFRSQPMWSRSPSIR